MSSDSAPPPSLVALRDRREAVIARISACYADDILDVEELDRRLDRAYAARSIAELDVLVADLAPTASTAPVASTALAVVDPQRLPTRRLRAYLSSIERRGRWSVPQQLEIRTFWGSMELDFRDASLGPGVTTIDVRVTMASLEVIVPPGLAVDVDLSCFAGSVEERHRVPPEDDPARPLLRFTGSVRFGSFELITRLPGDSRLVAAVRKLADSAKRLASGERGDDHKRLR